MVKLGSNQWAESNESSRENSPWYKQNLSLVDPNADSWFEPFRPRHASELFRGPFEAMGEVVGLLSYAARSDQKIVQSFEVSPEDLSSPLEIPDTELGQEFLKKLEQEQVSVGYKTTWAVNHESFEELDTKRRLQGQWATEAGTPFVQYLEIHKDQHGDEVAYWFVDLLVTPVPIEGVNHFEIESEEDGSVATYTLDTENGGFSIGELSTKLALPVFLKQLAFMSETPFPSTQIMTMSRDIAFSGVPDDARPSPFFTIKHYAEASGFSELQTSRNVGKNNAYEATIFPQIVQFGWRVSTKAIPYLGKLLPVFVNGCSSAMTTTEDGYLNFRSPDFSAPWDDVLGNPSARLIDGASRQSRAGAPQWIPVTQIGDMLVQTRDLYLRSIEDNNGGRRDAAREKLVRVIEDGAGPFLVHGINTFIYSHLLSELENNPELISEIEYFANQAADQLMEGQSTNAISNLGIAFFKLKDYESSSNAFLTALSKPDRFAEAEANYFMALIERARGNIERAQTYEERCRLAGGYKPDAGVMRSSESEGQHATAVNKAPSNHFIKSSREIEGIVPEPSEVSEALNLQELFPAIPENSIIPQLVANFGSKLKLSQSLSTTTFEGGEHSSDSYYVLLKLALLYSAVEGWERLAGKGLFSVSDQELADSLASEDAWKPFCEKLFSVTTSPKLRTSLQAFYDRETSDLIPLLTAIRHAFFHPGLTAANSSLAAKPKLRQLLLQTYSRVEESLLETFGQWAIKMRSWHELESLGDDHLIETAAKLDVVAGYPRAAVELEFDLKLSEEQWRILISEVWNEDEYDVEETITEVMLHLESYVEEHKAWNERITNSRHDSTED